MLKDKDEYYLVQTPSHEASRTLWSTTFLPWKAVASPPEAGGQHFLVGSRRNGYRWSASLMDLTWKGILLVGAGEDALASASSAGAA